MVSDWHLVLEKLLTRKSVSSRSILQYRSVFLQSMSIQWHLSFQVDPEELHVFVWWTIHGSTVWNGHRVRFVDRSRSGHVLKPVRQQIGEHDRSLAISHCLWLHLFPDVGLHHHLVSLVRGRALVFLWMSVYLRRYGLTIRPQSYIHSDIPYEERVSSRYQPYRLGVSNPLFFTNQEYSTPISKTFLTPPTTISNLDQWTRTITR